MSKFLEYEELIFEVSLMFNILTRILIPKIITKGINFLGTEHLYLLYLRNSFYLLESTLFKFANSHAQYLKYDHRDFISF